MPDCNAERMSVLSSPIIPCTFIGLLLASLQVVHCTTSESDIHKVYDTNGTTGDTHFQVSMPGILKIRAIKLLYQNELGVISTNADPFVLLHIYLSRIPWGKKHTSPFLKSSSSNYLLIVVFWYILHATQFTYFARVFHKHTEPLLNDSLV